MKLAFKKTTCGVGGVPVRPVLPDGACRPDRRRPGLAGSSTAERALVLGTLDRANVAAQLQAAGVDPLAARERVQPMTDQEVQALAQDIQSRSGRRHEQRWLVVIVLIAALIWYYAIPQVSHAMRVRDDVLPLGAAAHALGPPCCCWPAAARWCRRPSTCARLARGRAAPTEMTQVPFFPQDEYQCGPAALAMAMSYAADPVAAAGAGRRGVAAGAQWQPAAGDAGGAAPPRAGALPARAALCRPAARSGGRQPGDRAAGRRPAAARMALRGRQRLRLRAPAPSTCAPGGTRGRRCLSPISSAPGWPATTGRWWSRRPDDIAATATEARWLDALSAPGARAARSTPPCRLMPRARPLAGQPACIRGPGQPPACAWLARRSGGRAAHGAARHPQSVIVLNNLAQTLSDQGRNGEALALIRQAERPAESVCRRGALHPATDRRAAAPAGQLKPHGIRLARTPCRARYPRSACATRLTKPALCAESSQRTTITAWCAGSIHT